MQVKNPASQGRGYWNLWIRVAKLYDTFHIRMKRLDNLVESRRTTDPVGYFEQAFPALKRSIEAMFSGCVSSQHFSCSCRKVKIMSIVELSDLKLHWDSGYIRSASFCNLPKTTNLPDDVHLGDSPVTVAIVSPPYSYRGRRFWSFSYPVTPFLSQH